MYHAFSSSYQPLMLTVNLLFFQADIVITTPFHPAYLTREVFEKVRGSNFISFWPPYSYCKFAQAKNLKVCVTAGVGSDHVDLNTAVERDIQVFEVGI